MVWMECVESLITERLYRWSLLGHKGVSGELLLSDIAIIINRGCQYKLVQSSHKAIYK